LPGSPRGLGFPRFRPSLRFILERSLLLPLGAAIALVWANLDAGGYHAFAHTLEFAVNDIGMVFFFGLAMKEIVESALPGGALHTWRRAGMPIVAAAGGMIVPALCYVAIVQATGHPQLARGWAIPCATDIAFSYLVARAIFKDHPAIPFLLVLAIADDAFGLVVLAIFYPARALNLEVAALLMAVAIVLAIGLRRAGVRIFWPYVLIAGATSWTALFAGGLHPALALVPVIPFLPHAARDPGLFVDAPPDAKDALSEFEHWWKYPVQVVLFLFGLVNAGVAVTAIGSGTWAVLGAIVIGKPIGVGLSVGLAAMLGLKLPERTGAREVAIVGCAAGIGFTVALFFATAAFPQGAELDQAKLGALLSLLSGAAAFGVAWLLPTS
jgi:NhaA family Na+:H+ antiporter